MEATFKDESGMFLAERSVTVNRTALAGRGAVRISVKGETETATTLLTREQAIAFATEILTMATRETTY